MRIARVRPEYVLRRISFAPGKPPQFLRTVSGADCILTDLLRNAERFKSQRAALDKLATIKPGSFSFFATEVP